MKKAKSNDKSTTPFLYGRSFFYSVALAKWAEMFYKQIPKGTTTIVSRGSSGCTIASAILMLAALKKDGKKLSHHHVSKSKNHRRGTAGPEFLDENDKIVIVDDFVSSGKTIRAIVSHIRKQVPAFSYTNINVILATTYGVSRLKEAAQKLGVNLFFANGHKPIRNEKISLTKP